MSIGTPLRHVARAWAGSQLASGARTSMEPARRRDWQDPAPAFSGWGLSDNMILGTGAVSR
eukprot:CAMPEP_0179200190 /NCGR_PEP_ID=MMETSP0796-20121207/99622_1 /TAXON_ID=73915 /ORGANISM="Pyrodinium bahamense, Strain pbaha01" /LENGTH=60 /DNA_ID=CAMNT_0020904733 /DNA_START=52 /DNA_END=230 /DNA_ORIENTATION=-